MRKPMKMRSDSDVIFECCATLPSNPADGQICYDTKDNALYVYNADDYAWHLIHDEKGMLYARFGTSDSTSTIKELICTCCGGTIDKIKQKCMYCGTQYRI